MRLWRECSANEKLDLNPAHMLRFPWSMCCRTPSIPCQAPAGISSTPYERYKTIHNLKIAFT